MAEVAFPKPPPGGAQIPTPFVGCRDLHAHKERSQKCFIELYTDNGW